MKRDFAIGLAVLSVALPAAAPVTAAVKSVTPGGFEVAAEVSVAAAPDAAYAAIAKPSAWWSADHTYSGDAANLSLDPRAGGCFCEALPSSGSVEHMRVAYAVPGKALRLRGALGPLQGEGVDGALTWTLTPEGTGTKIVMSYVVGGYFRAGAEKIAPGVDHVLSDQLARLASYLKSSAR